MVSDPAPRAPALGAKGHWESVYRAKRVDELSWFQREPAVSFGLIHKVAPETSARIIDVGGGASSLVDALTAAGYSAVTVLDVSGAALGHAQDRLGPAASRVTWLESDVLVGSLPAGAFDVWHDRAVFHFLTEQSERAVYVAQIRQSLRPQGFVVVATFAEDGPARCSGLPVVRYSPLTLHDELGDSFQLLESAREQHRTPAGATQSFVYCVFQFIPHD
jgi:SAM-dependent methyltransferase